MKNYNTIAITQNKKSNTRTTSKSICFGGDPFLNNFIESIGEVLRVADSKTEH